MTPLQQLHREVYKFLMAYHQANPNFYFFPRRTKGTRNWENGYLFAQKYSNGTRKQVFKY